MGSAILLIIVASLALALVLVWGFRRLWQPRRQWFQTKEPSQSRESSGSPETWQSTAATSSQFPSQQTSGPTSVPLNEDEETIAELDSQDLPNADESDYLFGPLTPVLAALMPESEQRRATTKAELKTAGYYQPHAWQNLVALRYVGIMVPLVLFGLLLVLVPAEAETPVLVGLVSTPILGWALPRLYVKRRAAERLAEIERAVPDMLDMLNMGVAQGLTVSQALGRVSSELQRVHPALARELTIVWDQARLGTLEHALRNLSRRIDLAEIHSFTALLIQTQRMGTNVAKALSEYSDQMRQSLQQRSDEKANQAAFKLLFPTVLCLMPAVYLFLLSPALVDLSDFFARGGVDALETGREVIQDFRPTPAE